MHTQDSLTINNPSLPKGGGAIQSIGKGLGPVGTLGTASFDIPLPISPGRGYAPALSLGYSSHAGNGVCGLGWGLSHYAISRRTSKGVPTYTDDDLFEGPGGEVWMPERSVDGSIKRRSVRAYQGLNLGTTYQVARYQPRIKAGSELIEHWRSSVTDPGFWLVHASDGGLHLYGFNEQARIAAPATGQQRVAQWLLEESMNAHGEHIVYEYKQEDEQGLTSESTRDHNSQRYLRRVCYGNATAHNHLYAWSRLTQPLQWHFQLVFDYGERATGLSDQPNYLAPNPWAVRSDPYSSYAYGFELRTSRLCRQVLMFHHFPDELGEAPVLVKRLLLEYQATDLSYSQLLAAHLQAYDAKGQVEYRPPLEFSYSAFDIEKSRYHAFQNLPGLNDGQRYQLVDLYGEGLPGVLYRSDKSWFYREPQRAQAAQHPDEVSYGEWQALPRLPNADQHKHVSQSLTDLSGDGRLDWIVAQHGLHGFFTLNPDRSWSNFAPFGVFPREFFHPEGQLADLIGDGLSDLTLIGTQSVRLYSANPQGRGFTSATEVEHELPDDSLPAMSNSHNEVVAFSDVLGSGQQHLVRIRHNEIRCWPNLGHGNFGRGFRLAELPFAYDEFEASRILLADLDGSGAADILYLKADHVEIFMNRGGNGFEQQPRIQTWPEGVRYDRFCQVSTADLQGLGCSSLILTSPHGSPRHWRCDFITCKPYLLVGTNNNMGASGKVAYRSSAQEWLDEKQQLLAAGKPASCYVPFPIHLVSQQHQLDEITGNQLTQQLNYRQGYYDGHDREMRGFGLLLQSDSETTSRTSEREHDGAPLLTKTWFHTGRFVDLPGDDYDTSDSQAQPLGKALLFNDIHNVIPAANKTTQQEMARALSGLTLRVETFGLDGSAQQALPYAVQQTRYAVVLERSSSEQQPYAVMRPLVLESIAYHYERQPDDPLCQHTINLAWDMFDYLTHSVNVNYARRKTPQDEPPFSEKHEQTWWRDTHDGAQACYHLNETRAQFIQHPLTENRRLGLPYRQRSDALELAAHELTPSRISFEHFRDSKGPLKLTATRILTGLSVQRYKHPQLPDKILDAGSSTYQALQGYFESAELNETALRVYDSVLSPAQLEDRLKGDGYQTMATFLPADDAVLWSTCKGFVTYGTANRFYKVLGVKATQRQGTTTVGYDIYHCLPTQVTTADVCLTEAHYDYRLMLPTRIIDPNLNTQEALYDAFGTLRVSSFHGTERGQAAGFAPVSDYRVAITAPEDAIANPHSALQGAAAAHFSHAFAWMGRAPQDLINDKTWLAQQVALGNVLPNGYIRYSARLRLTTDPASTQWVSQAKREPAYAVSLLADRYPDDPQAAQIRISITSWDGFGRVLQTRQKVEPGDAYQTHADGRLAWQGGQPVTAASASRWRVSEGVEYNNKGLPIRVYRPFFADHYRYIDDSSLRQLGLSDQQFYDPSGRPTLTITAKGLWRRKRYLAWYSINEDENDTYDEAMADKARREKERTS
ncbi:SpvB/TcaC N-terminal domain-containing protein [Pseudomonas sp. NA-150]|uniref:SpvB/TcaC N-terminal domain-containing protein n=1 Tax=Pseudomonas sp. NA-150 TaxID=3367525 RepID=UPI0037C83321